MKAEIVSADRYYQGGKPAAAIKIEISDIADWDSIEATRALVKLIKDLKSACTLFSDVPVEESEKL